MIGTLGWQEIAFIFLLALLLFGPKELPRIARTIGHAITEFRRASSGLKAQFDRELSNLERETQPTHEASDYRYDYGYDAYRHAASHATEVTAPPAESAEPARLAAPEGTVPAASETPAPPVEPPAES